MSTVILSCESLEVYVAAAQKTAGTEYPVIWLKQKYHEDPAVMRSRAAAHHFVIVAQEYKYRQFQLLHQASAASA